MTRGRKKDLTIPPSRALTQQRDYRARKAQYLSDLEDRCRQLEEENEKLRAENNAIRKGSLYDQSSVPSQDIKLADASTELMSTLETAGRALDNFRRLAHQSSPYPSRPRDSAIDGIERPPLSSIRTTQPYYTLRPASFPSPESSDASSPDTAMEEYNQRGYRASSERSWHDEAHPNYPPPPGSLRKILCDPPPDSPSPSVRPYESPTLSSSDRRS